jgi:hypothetical protein
MQSRRELFQAAPNRQNEGFPTGAPQVHCLLTVDLCYLAISPIFVFWRTCYVSTVIL